MKALVLLFWASVIAAIVYRYHNTITVREFWGGVSDIWSSVVHAKIPDRLDTTRGDSYDCGVAVGFISVIIAAIVTLCIAGYTLYLAW